MRSLFVTVFALMSVQCFAQDPGGPTGLAAGAPKPGYARTEPVKAGEEAPDFTLPSSTGETVKLSQYRGKTVVLYFYPKDNTPGCTAEAENFTKDIELFEKAGAVVLGVSVDNEASHKAFAKKFELKFPLLADVGGKVAREYGVMGWIMAKRVTFLIGPDGKVTRAYTEVDVEKHSKEVLSAIQGDASSAKQSNESTPKPSKAVKAKKK